MLTDDSAGSVRPDYKLKKEEDPVADGMLAEGLELR